MDFYGDNIHTVRIKAAIMKAAAVALVTFAVISLVIIPTIALFIYGFGDALGIFIVFSVANFIVAAFSGMFLEDLPEALGKIKAHEEREAQEKQREAEAVLRDFDRRRNNH